MEASQNSIQFLNSSCCQVLLLPIGDNLIGVRKEPVNTMFVLNDFGAFDIVYSIPVPLTAPVNPL